MNKLASLSEVARMIESGRTLALAGPGRVLFSLPVGNWIGGTSHYVVGPEGGVKCDNLIHVTDLGDLGIVRFARYGADEMERLAAEMPANGFTFAIVPAGSTSLRAFARRPDLGREGRGPLVGWVAGVDLDVLHGARPQVFSGQRRQFEFDALVAAHVTLPAGRRAALAIINPFEPAEDHVIEFDAAGFSAVDCFVDGRRERLADFLARTGYAHGRLPLIAEIGGRSQNVSFQAVECVSGRVEFFGPVAAGVKYRIARPLAEREQGFAGSAPGVVGGTVAFSCNCILNHLYGYIGTSPGSDLQGPLTFGEIGDCLLNQTVVSLEIH